MGIKGLTKFVADHAPKAIRQQEFSSLMGRILAVDASLSLYQFMVAIRDAETFGTLTNEAGETTSHISGMLSRAVRLLENGIKPVYVFDGKPPTLKSGELAKRSAKRAEAEMGLEAAEDKGDRDEIKKFMGRTVKVTRQHNADVKRLLRLMGIPIMEAPCEAEAQCAKLCSDGKVYATATEDADALTFGSDILVRHLNFSDQKAKGSPILVITLKTILEELEISYEQFVDFCILCGCDYCDTIKGIGPGNAFRLIKQHKTIEKVLQSIDRSKYPVPECFPYQEAREFFLHPEISDTTSSELRWTEPDWEGLRNFLVDEHSFNPTRVDNYLNRLKKAKGKASQTRLENFFGGVSTKKSTDGPQPAKPKGKAKSKAKPKANPPPARTSAAKRSQPEPISIQAESRIATNSGGLVAEAAASMLHTSAKRTRTEELADANDDES